VISGCRVHNQGIIISELLIFLELKLLKVISPGMNFPEPP